MATNTDTVESSTVFEQLAFDTKTAKSVGWSEWAFKIVAPFEIEVQNLSYGYLAEDHTYRVMVDEQGVPVSCTCPGYKHYHGPNDRVGKHMLAVATVGGPTLLEAARAFPPNHESKTPAGTAALSEKMKPDGGRDVVENTTDIECAECASLSGLSCFDCVLAGRRELPE